MGEGIACRSLFVGLRRHLALAGAVFWAVLPFGEHGALLELARPRKSTLVECLDLGWPAENNTSPGAKLATMLNGVRGSARMLGAEIATNRPDFAAWKPLSARKQSFGTSRKPQPVWTTPRASRGAVGAALGRVWHGARTSSTFVVGDICVRCKEEVGVAVTGIRNAVRSNYRRLALVYRAGVTTVWIDGSGQHSSGPQHRRCGVGYYTSARRAGSVAVVRALEERQPHEIVSDYKGVVKAVQALQTGRRQWCLDCGRQTGKVKGNYNFSYLKRLDCHKLKKKTKVKSGLPAFLAPEVRWSGLGSVRPDGGTIGGSFSALSIHESGSTGSVIWAESGSTGALGVEQPGRAAACFYFPLSRQSQKDVG
eukprot:330265-Amphidinium_carterae.1